ncbi:hypothetical protein CBR_g20053 [Chara braunii]|uniref:Myb-like domain-containing protein n=1 Tax=Chara braunii TaxID=69332 RepID=A0A388KZP5_CHABU|nr:hypothetical protein CBR_g20053 [Chara braunii]|eukprot:GBG75423.1 hypothetical protein CBR_g20053 [Chara braunii]
MLPPRMQKLPLTPPVRPFVIVVDDVVDVGNQDDDISIDGVKEREAAPAYSVVMHDVASRKLVDDVGKPLQTTPTDGVKKNRPWVLEEKVDLVECMREDDALMANASGRIKCMKRSKRNEWVVKRMSERGWNKIAEDYRKKWSELTNKLRIVRDKCGGSAKPSYWDMTGEQFEQQLWEAMEWYKNLTGDGASTKAQASRGVGTVGTLDMGVGTQGVGTSGGGGPGGTSDGAGKPMGPGPSHGGDAPIPGGGTTDESESARKICRTGSRKTHASQNSAPPVSSVAQAMHESTSAYCESLDRALEKAVGTLGRASKESVTVNAVRIGDMATQIGNVATTMQLKNHVLEMLVGVMARRRGSPGGGDDPASP